MLRAYCAKNTETPLGLMRAAGATERLLELLHADAAIKEPANAHTLLNPKQAAISFKNVLFHYPSRPQIAALDHVSLEIAAGETIALVAPAALGKPRYFNVC